MSTGSPEEQKELIVAAVAERFDDNDDFTVERRLAGDANLDAAATSIVLAAASLNSDEPLSEANATQELIDLRQQVYEPFLELARYLKQSASDDEKDEQSSDFKRSNLFKVLFLESSDNLLLSLGVEIEEDRDAPSNPPAVSVMPQGGSYSGNRDVDGIRGVSLWQTVVGAPDSSQLEQSRASLQELKAAVVHAAIILAPAFRDKLPPMLKSDAIDGCSGMEFGDTSIHAIEPERTPVNVSRDDVGAFLDFRKLDEGAEPEISPEKTEQELSGEATEGFRSMQDRLYGDDVKFDDEYITDNDGLRLDLYDYLGELEMSGATIGPKGMYELELSSGNKVSWQRNLAETGDVKEPEISLWVDAFATNIAGAVVETKYIISLHNRVNSNKVNPEDSHVVRVGIDRSRQAESGVFEPASGQFHVVANHSSDPEVFSVILAEGLKEFVSRNIDN
jgi:hypothetical protein